MFQDNVFCFTPKGEVIKLPKEATPIILKAIVLHEMGKPRQAQLTRETGLPLPSEPAIHAASKVGAHSVGSRSKLPKPFEHWKTVYRSQAQSWTTGSAQVHHGSPVFRQPGGCFQARRMRRNIRRNGRAHALAAEDRCKQRQPKDISRQAIENQGHRDGHQGAGKKDCPNRMMHARKLRAGQ